MHTITGHVHCVVQPWTPLHEHIFDWVSQESDVSKLVVTQKRHRITSEKHCDNIFSRNDKFFVRNPSKYMQRKCGTM